MEDQIKADLKQAMLAKDEIKVSTLRLLSSELTYAKIQKGDAFSNQDIVAVIRKELKKRKEGAEGFRKGGNEAAALKEEAEAKILEAYLPAEMSDEELTKIVEEAINKLGASSISDMGKVIGLVMGQTGGSVDGSRVSGLVKTRLQG